MSHDDIPTLIDSESDSDDDVHCTPRRAADDVDTTEEDEEDIATGRPNDPYDWGSDSETPDMADERVVGSNPTPLSFSSANVYVLEVGSDECPGDKVLEGIKTRSVRHLCVPGVHEWLRTDFNGWLFLKISRRGCKDESGCNYVSLAVKVGHTEPAGEHPTCACTGQHYPGSAVRVAFSEAMTFSKVRVSYSCGRGPYQMPVGDEAASLQAALARGRLVESPEDRLTRYNASRDEITDKYGLIQHSTARVMLDTGKGTHAEARQTEKVVREQKHSVGDPFVSRRTHRPPHVPVGLCCESRQCSAK